MRRDEPLARQLGHDDARRPPSVREHGPLQRDEELVQRRRLQGPLNVRFYSNDVEFAELAICTNHGGRSEFPLPAYSTGSDDLAFTGWTNANGVVVSTIPTMVREATEASGYVKTWYAGGDDTLKLYASFKPAKQLEITVKAAEAGGTDTTSQIKVTKEWLDTVVAAGTSEKTDAEIKEVLEKPVANEKSDLAYWQAYLLGLDPTDPNAELKVEKTNGDEDDKALVVSTVQVSAPDAGIKVGYSLDKVGSDEASVAKEGAEQTTKDLRIDLEPEGETPTGYYKMNVIFTPTEDGVEKEGEKVKIPADNTIGVLKVESDEKLVPIAVPWNSLDNGGEITAAEIVKTFKISEMPFLGDFSIGSSQLSYSDPNLKGMVSLALPVAAEIMAELAQQVVPNRVLVAIQDLLCRRLVMFKRGMLKLFVKAERAPLMHVCPDAIRISYAGVVPAGEGVVWDSSKQPHEGIIGDYVPYIWVGGPLRGIAVFGENNRGWIEAEGVRHQEIVREKDGTVVLRLNLIGKACDITEERTIRIGFMATPTKPMPENWRAHDPGHFIGSGMCWGAGQTDSDVCPWDGTTEFWAKLAETRRTGKVDEAFLKATDARYPYAGEKGSKEWNGHREQITRHYRSGFSSYAGNRGKRPMTWYTNARGVDFSTKQGATFCDEWSRQEWMWTRDFDILAHRDYDMDPVPSFRDYAAWWYKKAIEMGVCEYYYWDDIYLSPNFDLVGTDAYVLPDGRIQPSVGIFNMRALIRRCAVIQAELGMKGGANWVHMTDTAMAPICSFAGVDYDMEDVVRAGTAYQEKYPKAYLEAVSTGRQFGNRPKAMAYYTKTTPEKNAWYERTGAGIMLCYEFRWKYNSYVFNRVHDKLKAWGYRTPAVRVWNYWNGDEPYPLKVKREKTASIAMAREKVEKRGGGGEKSTVHLHLGSPPPSPPACKTT